MRFIKVIFATVLGVFALIFIVQNRTAMEQALVLRFDIYVASAQSPPVPLWIVILFCFFLGVFTASLYGLYELIMQRQTIRKLRHNLEVLSEELTRASVPAGASSSPPRPEPEEGERPA